MCMGVNREAQSDTAIVQMVVPMCMGVNRRVSGAHRT